MATMEKDSQIIKTEYSELMKKSYIDYAMSVIVSRALPDVRDGLKPVQRRVLYDMYELGIKWDKPYRKSARIVGDTMGKYHPHGDSSIYESLVVMSQEFKKGLPLVDGHGNFGSIEGDGAAAMRYTEARLEKVTQEVYLGDLDKDVINFVPNFDETEKEPEVLPVRVPNLLVNGAEGIAVGMTTSIPPHNLGEVVDGVKAMIKNPDISTEKLMTYIPGPDFPTGGHIVNQDELLGIYETGVGKIKVRGKVQVEKIKGGKEQIVITEIPYTMIGANIGKFLNDVANLVETKKTTDINDISNMSSKDGIRIVIELKKGADAQNIINLLYKKTRLEDTFGVNMLAVTDGKPETLGLKGVIEHHIEFQFDVCTRKYQNLLAKELGKKEIQEGLIKACDCIDLIIEILRGSKNKEQVKKCLVEGITEGIKFKSAKSEKEAKILLFTEKQADAILEMRLYRLIGLEIDALTKEHAETIAKIAQYEDILNNYASMAKVIMKDLEQTKKEFAKERKTEIENAEEAVFEEQPIQEMEVVTLIDKFGYARVVDQVVYEKNKEAADAENKYIIFSMNTDRLCVFTDTGKEHIIKIEKLPYGKFRDKGTPIDNLCGYTSAEEQVVYISNMEDIITKKFMFITKQGMIKIVDGTEFNVSRYASQATKLLEEDTLVVMDAVSEEEYLVLQSEQGMFLRFALEEAPEKKKAAVGVRGMKLSDKDSVSHGYLMAAGEDKIAMCGEKEVHINRLKINKRGGKGTKNR